MLELSQVLRTTPPLPREVNPSLLPSVWASYCGAERAKMWRSLFIPFLGACCFILSVHRVKWALVTELKSEEWYRNRCFRSRSREGTGMLRQWPSGRTEREDVIYQSWSTAPRRTTMISFFNYLGVEPLKGTQQGQGTQNPKGNSLDQKTNKWPVKVMTFLFFRHPRLYWWARRLFKRIPKFATWQVNHLT